MCVLLRSTSIFPSRMCVLLRSTSIFPSRMCVLLRSSIFRIPDVNSFFFVAMSETEQVPTPVVEDDIKVFCGNLPFAITDEEISEFFGSCGQITSVAIIKRFGRSLGFGFVSFATTPEAEKAVLLDKTELSGRAINVEIAHKKAPVAEGEKPERKPRSKKDKSRKPAAETEGSEDVTDLAARIDDVDIDDEKKLDTPKQRTRKPRQKREPYTGPLSETMLFVSNLPFKVKDDDLRAIFQEFNVISARVICLADGKSKGFGFVEVETHEEQSRVLNEFSSIVVDGRELIVKQANAVPVKDEP